MELKDADWCMAQMMVLHFPSHATGVQTNRERGSTVIQQHARIRALLPPDFHETLTKLILEFYPPFILNDLWRLWFGTDLATAPLFNSRQISWIIGFRIRISPLILNDLWRLWRGTDVATAPLSNSRQISWIIRLGVRIRAPFTILVLPVSPLTIFSWKGTHSVIEPLRNHYIHMCNSKRRREYRIFIYATLNKAL